MGTQLKFGSLILLAFPDFVPRKVEAKSSGAILYIHTAFIGRGMIGAYCEYRGWSISTTVGEGSTCASAVLFRNAVTFDDAQREERFVFSDLGTCGTRAIAEKVAIAWVKRWIDENEAALR
ncbi:hypothetical protein AWB73_01930 [Caballeronia turbans]|nr:hypothetical protein AWB73_01930 [Caballeronia turbans]